ncbi:MAG: HNH endonuclease signature motif containing protein [Dehalococcoidia bacterium]|nr:HNH endonuclease signature motif containing protein [Dehalococcoidia bacterium]
MQHHSNIPQGFCQCGCGQKTQVATRTQCTRGQVKGRFLRFVKGHNHQTISLEGRYWAKVTRGAAPDDCWTWCGAKSKGYGYFHVTRRPRVRVFAHRFSYDLQFGPIPDGLDVLHSCDHPQCSNPRHLFLGTQRDNLADMRRKGRGFVPIGTVPPPVHRGERHPKTHLTDALVREIRTRYPHRTVTRAGFAAQYGITDRALKHIIAGDSWRHVK